MANEQPAGPSVAERVTDGAARARDAVIRTVNPPMAGGYSVVGRWLCQRDNGLESIFTLELGGKGSERLRLGPDEFVNIPCEWRLDNGKLVIISHGDRVYTHRTHSQESYGFRGLVTVEDSKDSEFSLFPYR